MLGKIIGFELRYRFKKPMTYIFMAIMIFQAIWYVKGTYDYYVNDATFFNAAGIIYESLAGGGMLMVVVIAIITGTALFKDIEYKTGETFYSYPINDKIWLAGKFIAAYLINLSIVMAFALGFAIVQYTGLAAPEQFGPVPWGHLAYGFLIFSIPNMFVITTISLSMVVFFRNMASSYLGVFLLVMLFIMAESARENTANIKLVYLLDPMGFCFTKDAIDLLPVAMKNTAYFHLSGIYWANRALWIGIASVFTLFAFRKFSFKYFIARPGSRKKMYEEVDMPLFSGKMELMANKVFGTAENIRKLFRLSQLEFINTVRPVGFKIIMGLVAVMFFGYNFLWNAEYYIHSDTLPITSTMTFTRLPNGVYIFILLAIFSGELLYKERSNNIWEITDPLPVPTWVTYFSKYLAMIGIGLIFVLLLLIPGILAQVFQGFTDIEWNVYFTDLFSYHFGIISYLNIITLAFFLGSVTANRFAGHILSVAVIFFIVLFADMGVIEQWRFTFPFTPGIEDYSEMNSYGVYGDAAVSYNILWGFLSLVFLFSGLWFWNRGSQKPIMKRFAISKPQLHYAGKIAVIVFLAGFFYMEHYVMANDKDMGNFKTEDLQEAEDAEYEKLYKYIEAKKQPKICGLDVTVAIVPGDRKADYVFNMMLTNCDSVAIDTLYFNLKDFVTLHSLMLYNKSLSPSWEGKYGQLAYALPQPLMAQDTISLKGNCTLQYVGFCTNDPQRALVYNGSFLEDDIIPHIGYNDERELDENRGRRSYGLEKLLSRMNAVDNAEGLKNEALSPQSLRYKTTLRVHTSDDQIAYASGMFKGVETFNDKTYSVFETESPFAKKWEIGCGRYEKFNRVLNNGTELNILYDIRHNYNLDNMGKAVEDGIAFLSKYLGAYPYMKLTIAEIPFYNDDDFYASPNLIAISEKHCWTADGKRDKDLSYIYYTLCREIVKQWVQQNVCAADVQGAEMLLTAIPEAYALFYVQEKYGDEVLQVYLDKKMERYSKNRANEPNMEPPLIYADNIDYLEANKGAMELLKVIDNVGIDNFSKLLISWISEDKDEYLVFKDFYEELKKRCPEEKEELMVMGFEEVLD